MRRLRCHWAERRHITFHVTGGQAYQIAVDSTIVTDASWVFEQIPASNARPAADRFSCYRKLVTGVLHPVQTTNVTVGGGVGLDLEFTPAPGNDDFEQRTQLVGFAKRMSPHRMRARASRRASRSTSESGGSSVAYSWMAPAPAGSLFRPMWCPFTRRLPHQRRRCHINPSVAGAAHLRQ